MSGKTFPSNLKSSWCHHLFASVFQISTVWKYRNLTSKKFDGSSKTWIFFSSTSNSWKNSYVHSVYWEWSWRNWCRLCVLTVSKWVFFFCTVNQNIYCLITQLIIINTATLTELFRNCLLSWDYNCLLLKDISVNSKCLLVLGD